MMQCFKFCLKGKVLTAPTEVYNVSGEKLDAVRWTMQVSIPPFRDDGKAIEMSVELWAWGKARAAACAAALRVGKEACVMGNVVRRRMLNEEGGYATRQDGSHIWLTDFRANDVFLPAYAPVGRQHGKPATARGESGQNNCIPTGRPPFPMDEDDDIAF